jgi:hypothetical protein
MKTSAFDDLLTELADIQREPLKKGDHLASLRDDIRYLAQRPSLSKAHGAALKSTFEGARQKLAASIGCAPALEISKMELMLARLGQRLFVS